MEIKKILEINTKIDIQKTHIIKKYDQNQIIQITEFKKNILDFITPYKTHPKFETCEDEMGVAKMAEDGIIEIIKLISN